MHVLRHYVKCINADQVKKSLRNCNHHTLVLFFFADFSCSKQTLFSKKLSLCQSLGNYELCNTISL